MPGEPPSIEDRLERIEARLAWLERVIEDALDATRRGTPDAARAARPRPPLEAPAARVPPPPARPRAPAFAPPVARPEAVVDPIRRAFEGKGTAWWLSRAGVGLLLLGVAFLFKYAVDEGWLTPAIRVALGLSLGLALSVIGLRVRRERRWFGALALGGASATFYITGYAAFQLFQLVPYATAMGFLVAVTVGTLWAGWTTDEAALGVLGAIGGLATPFLLHTDSGTVAQLAGYEAAVVAGGAGIYLRKGWRSLLWTTVVGGWWVLALGLFTLEDRTDTRLLDQWALQLAVVVAVLAFWGVPVLRERLATANPARWPRPSFTPLERALGRPEGSLRDRGPQVLALTTPLIAYLFTTVIWSPADQVAAAIAAGAAAVWGAAWWRLRDRESADPLASVHAVAAAVLLAIALQLLFESHTLLLTWMVESTALLWMARRTGDRLVRVSAHLLATIVGLWLVARLVEGPAGGWAAATDALVIGLAAAGAVALEGRERQVYRVAILTATALWLRRELPALPGGDAVVLFAWSLLAAAALRLGSWWRDRGTEAFAHALFIVTGMWLLNWLVSGEAGGVAVGNLPAALCLATLGCALAATRRLADRDQADIYAVAVHVLFLGWLWHELSRLPAGHAWVTVSWGVYGVSLLVAGLRMDHTGLRKMALATVGAVIVKLFLVDLSQLEPIWRILLFLGFGGAFMALSYYFPSLWKAKGGSPDERAP
jgi:uncharacterized membrane protein